VSVRKRESGAAVIEFALASSVFFLIVFGIVQYGLYFNDALNVRQGVREAVRQGVVAMPIADDECGGPGMAWDKLRCYTAAQVGAVTGDTQVHLVVPNGWQKPDPLIVCAAVHSDGGIGLLPMPDDGVITSVARMSIEQDAAPPSGSPANTDPDPTGRGWAWCR
jgi:hypothetical protein